MFFSPTQKKLNGQKIVYGSQNFVFTLASSKKNKYSKEEIDV